MRKYSFVILISIAISIGTVGQGIKFNREYKLIIDSLRSSLPQLKDSAEVDCLNLLSENFPYLFGYNAAEFNTRGDSMFKYSSMAYKGATRIGYKYGIGVSILNMVQGRNFMNIKNGGPAPQWKDSSFAGGNMDSIFAIEVHKALLIGEQIQNEKLLGRAYYDLARYEAFNENLKRSAYHFQKAGQKIKELELLISIVWNYTNGEENVEGFEYAERCIELTKEIKPMTPWEHEMVQWSYKNMADMYKTVGDYETAMAFVMKSEDYGKAHNGMKMDISLCELYYLMGKYDSAVYYWQNWKEDYDSYYFGHKANGNSLLGKIYIKQGLYDKAIEMFDKSLDAFKKDGKYDLKMSYGLITPLIFKGEAYIAKKNYKAALIYTKQGLGFADKHNATQSKAQAYELLSRIYYQLNKNDSAYLYIRKYIAIKDSIQNRQFLFRLNNYKKEAEEQKKLSQINLLNKDNQLKEQELKQEVIVRNSLIIGIILLFLLGVFVFRNLLLKRKNEKLQLKNELDLQRLENDSKHAELKQQAVELEMQALRAQMNPHFIFNCLSSINRFIFKNEPRAASDYLTRFSRLIRMVLMHSQKKLVPLEDELEMLRLYLDMERLRFRNSFDYTVATTNAIESTSIFIPPLLLQPFCENAIWHGLMHKEGHGHLTISISEENKILHCVIEDDGVGREKAATLKSKSAEREKSMGLQITAKRLALLNGENSTDTFYEIDDIVNESGDVTGTKVSLKIRYKESIEELV